MVNILLRIAYLGTSFNGSQRQKSSLTAQSCLEEALSKIYKKPIETLPSSRLDKGVSAEDWGVSYQAEEDIDFYRLKFAINNLLPREMHVKEISYIPLEETARKLACSKTYLYRISLKEADPVEDVVCWSPDFRFDKEVLKKTLLLFKGEHDFSSFYSADKDEEECPFKAIEDIYTEEKEGYLYIYVKGRSFGRYEVRFIVGAAYEVARNGLSAEEIEKRLEGKTKGSMKFKAPGYGLTLLKTEFAKEGEKDA
jgi:tRNA pseudouridine38-40 synthase